MALRSRAANYETTNCAVFTVDLSIWIISIGWPRKKHPRGPVLAGPEIGRSATLHRYWIAPYIRNRLKLAVMHPRRRIRLISSPDDLDHLFYILRTDSGWPRSGDVAAHLLPGMRSRRPDNRWSSRQRGRQVCSTAGFRPSQCIALTECTPLPVIKPSTTTIDGRAPGYLSLLGGGDTFQTASIVCEPGLETSCQARV